AHAGALASVCPDVVGNDPGVARIVFGNAGFDLADEVAADVSTLGEDAAAETGEDRDQGSTEAERDQRVDHDTVVGLEAHDLGQIGEIDGDTEQRQTRHQHA